MRNVFGVVNFHSAPDILPITESRPLGSTSFLGRYAFCDFALSNLCNSGISQVGLLIKDHQRSILKHLGDMSSWVINTKIGHQRVLYNEPAHLDPRLNTDVNNLLENDWLLYDASTEYICIVPSHIIVPMDLRPFLQRHIESRRSATIITTKVRNLHRSWFGAKVFTFDDNGGLASIQENHGQIDGAGYVCMDTLIINRPTLIDIIRRYSPTHPLDDLLSLLLMAFNDGYRRVGFDFYEGFSRPIDSFQHYMEYSFEFLDKKKADQIFLKDWPIYTLTHDTPPALYSTSAEVHNSYISNGARIEGKVINSIIARNVYIGKGAVIKNSIVFSTVRINEGAIVENALVDKYSIIERGHVIKGKAKEPIYVRQGAIL